MIYCNLKGGLGNMLFQIAASKSFAIDNGTDCIFPNLDTHLGYLNSEKTYNPTLSHSFEYREIFKNLVSTPSDTQTVISFPFHYSKPNLPSNNLIVDGFFQSEKYFKHNRKEVIKYLNFNPIKDIITEKYGKLLSQRTTSIHVRRGDYVRHPNHHPSQSIKYYNESMNLLKSITETFVVFSDDIEWCKNNLKNDNIIYITDEKDYIELYLMSLCDNNIISNSSFSWWGAWLNNNNKKVVGPKKWFGSDIKHDTSDIIPDSWIKI